MNNSIIEPNNLFDFSSITLANPIAIQGGAYFTKILNNGKPVYIQTPKSLTKQGFIKNGKKVTSDLMFDNTNEQFIQWIENLETKCHELIYDKRELWFQNTLDKNDVENSFTSPIKVYKSGKYYLVRVNSKINSITNVPSVRIYNENESPMQIEDITSDTTVISILEIQGIKFTTRNFQFEIELKQSMVLNVEEIFENCIIKTNKNSSTSSTESSRLPVIIPTETQVTPTVKKNETSLVFCMDNSPTKDFYEDSKRPENLSGRCNYDIDNINDLHNDKDNNMNNLFLENLSNDILNDSENKNNQPVIDLVLSENNQTHNNNTLEDDTIKNYKEILPIKEINNQPDDVDEYTGSDKDDDYADEDDDDDEYALPKLVLGNDINPTFRRNVSHQTDDSNLEQSVLEEIDFDIEENETIVKNSSEDIEEFDVSKITQQSTDTLGTMSLKQPNEVYFEIYKAAKQKAIEMKKNTILAFLEAKNIKKTYKLDGMYESDEEDMMMM